jgi:hypothetical protein
MKRLKILTLILVFARLVSAQENISVSLRSDNNQPFTAKISGKQMNSSLSGYLQIPGLRDSTYEMTISFPENKFPEQQLRFAVSKTDTNFYLKRSGDHSWVIQSDKQPFSAGGTARTGDVYLVKRTEAFAVLMAAVVDDTSVLYTSMVKTEPAPQRNTAAELPPVVAANNVSTPSAQQSSEKDPAKNKTDAGQPKQQDSALTRSVAVNEEKKILPPVVDANTTIVKNNDLKKEESRPSPQKDSAARALIVQNTDTRKPETDALATAPQKDTSNQTPVKKELAADAATGLVDSAKEKTAVPVMIKSSEENKPAVPDSSSMALTKKPVSPPAINTTDTVKSKPDEKENKTVQKPLLDTDKRIFQLGVVKAAEHKDEKATHIVFIDRAGPEHADTINITIMSEPASEYKPSEPLFRPVEKPATGNTNKATDSSVKKDSLKRTGGQGNGSAEKTVIRNEAGGIEKKDSLKNLDKRQAAPDKPAVKDSTVTGKRDSVQKSAEPLFRPIQKDEPAAGSGIVVDSLAAKKDSSKKAYAPEPVWRPLEKKTTAMVNSDCQNFATEYDLDRLRVKMLAENNVDDRIVAARKVFKTKCFSAKQLRALSELFTNDEGRYKFLDAAYPYVSDTDSFKGLSDLLKDPYYLNRFNAMIRK